MGIHTEGPVTGQPSSPPVTPFVVSTRSETPEDLTMFADDDLVSISALAQYAYCPRRAALLFLEQQWADNIFTVEGRHVHQHAHRLGRKERLPDGYLVRGLLLKSERLGLVGAADVVEFHENSPNALQVVVVEYKRGKHKRFGQLEYRIQLCAQVICLEEMLHLPIPSGTLFFAKSKRRLDVACDEKLRTTVEKTVECVRQLFNAAQTPPAEYGRKCRGCSLFDICMPRTAMQRNVAAYIKRMFLEPDES